MDDKEQLAELKARLSAWQHISPPSEAVNVKLIIASLSIEIEELEIKLAKGNK